MSAVQPFAAADWSSVPNGPGAYVILDRNAVIYVGMAGRNGNGGLRRRLRDHASGQIVNMFAQYLFLARAQFLQAERVTHPKDARGLCRRYIIERCGFCFLRASNSAEARRLEQELKVTLRPAFNG